MNWKTRAVLALLAVGVAGWFTVRSVDMDPAGYLTANVDTVLPEVVDSVSPEDLSQGLNRAAESLSVGETNVVLAVLCTMRKDRLETYGHNRPTSPFLDALGRQSVVLNRHYTQAPWTRPSMGALFTGIWPRSLQLDNPGARGSLKMVLREEYETIAELLEANGYTTIGSTGNPNLKAKFGLAQGLQQSWEPENTYKQGRLIINGFKQVDYLLGELDKAPVDKPVYMRLVLTDTHQPRRPRKKYARLFHDGLGRIGRLDGYDASVRKVDAILAELFVEVMKQRPNTLFIIASDHGEGLRYPKHHGKGHGNHLYESHIGSPSIWNHPSLGPQRFDGLSMNIDVKPTIMGLLGIENGRTTDGVDMSEALLGTGEWAGHPYAFSETFYGRSNKATVISPSHQLIRAHRTKKEPPVVERLYASSDVLAKSNLIGQGDKAEVELQHRLDEWLRLMDTNWAKAGEPIQTELGADLEAQLQALGYME